MLALSLWYCTIYLLPLLAERTPHNRSSEHQSGWVGEVQKCSIQLPPNWPDSVLLNCQGVSLAVPRQPDAGELPAANVPAR